MRRTLRALLANIVVACFAAGVFAQERAINLATIPDCLPASDRAELDGRRSNLQDRINDYNTKVHEFRRTCGRVRTDDTTSMRYCQTEQTSMEELQEELVRATSNFKISMDSALENAKNSSDRRVQSLRAKIEQDRNALANLGFQADVETLDGWAKLRGKEREKFEEIRLNAIVTILLETAAGTARYLRPLNPWNVNAKIKGLKGSIWDQPIIRKTLKDISRISGKTKAERGVAYGKAVVDALMRSKEAAKALGAEDSAEILMAIAKLSILLLRNPVTQIQADEALSVCSILYYETRSRLVTLHIDTLLELDDRKMAALNQISKLLKQHVEQLNISKRELTDLQACY